MTISYRFLGEADAAAFLDIRLRALTDHPDAFGASPEEWGTSLKVSAGRLAANPTIGAFDGSALVGIATLGLTARERVKVRHKVEIWAVYVAPEGRASGVARAMMERLLDEARRRGFEWAMLNVGTHNRPARRLYGSLGFKSYGIERNHMKLPDGRYIDDDLMEIDLRGEA